MTASRSVMRVLGLALGLVTMASPARGADAKGPLKPLDSNPRYFTDGSGKAIYLAGSHNWNNFEDTGHRQAEMNGAPPKFDYDAYLDFLQKYHCNFFRLWRWEVPMWNEDEPPQIAHAAPHPWLRSGPGLAADGQPRFDLAHFNQEYFERMRSRIIKARERGMYVSVMLFEGWAVQARGEAWKYHPFNPANNSNGIDADTNHDGRGIEFYTLQRNDMGARVLALQEAYVRKVVDTVNDLDNVLYEICNEPGGYSLEWQYHIIRFVKQYEAGKPQQHPVGMSFAFPGGTNDELFNSPADWVEPGHSETDDRYRTDPPSKYAGKVVVNDTDHLWGHYTGDGVWVWESFMRGLNVLFMDDLRASPTWQDSARRAMGQTMDWSRKIDLAHMTPHEELASTKYCLANPGVEYLALQPRAGWIRLDLKAYPREFAVEWFNINTGETIDGGAVRGGDSPGFVPPFGAPAVLHVKAIDKAQ
jgi:hypothetical protein